MCSSSLPGPGDRDDAELLGHLFHRGGGRGSAGRPPLAAAVRVQGPGGHRVAGETRGESGVQGHLRHRGHPVPRPACGRCAQQVPAAPAPQVPLLLLWGGAVPVPRAAGGEVCPGCLWVLGLGSVLGENGAFLAVCALEKAPCQALGGCWRKRHGAFLYTCVNVFLAVFKPHLGTARSALILNWDPEAEFAVLRKGPGFNGPKVPSKSSRYSGQSYGSLCVVL